MPNELDQLRAELADSRRRIERAEALLIALLERKADQPLPPLASNEERVRLDRIVRQFADLQAEVEARGQ